MYQVTKKNGETLNVTCRCSDGLPYWFFVNADNVSDTYYVTYGHDPNDPLPANTEFIKGMEEVDGMNYLCITIITNLTYSIVLQCTNHGGNVPRTNLLVVAVNKEPPGGITFTDPIVSYSLSICTLFNYVANLTYTVPKCPSSTPHQLTTMVTSNSTTTTTNVITTQTSTCSKPT